MNLCFRFLVAYLLGSTAITTVDGAESYTWINVQQSGGIEYVFKPFQIERYSLGDRVFLPPLRLSAPSGSLRQALAVPNALYIAQGRSIYRYDLDGSNPRFLVTTDGEVSDLHVDGNLLLVSYYSPTYSSTYCFLSLNLDTGAVVAKKQLTGGIAKGVLAPSRNKLFGGRGSYASISSITYGDDGSYLSDENFSGDIPHEFSGLKPWIFPGETRLLDGIGQIFDAGSFRFLGSLGRYDATRDVVFIGTNPILAHENKVTAFGPGLQPTGTVVLSTVPEAIALDGSDLLAFSVDNADPHGIRITVIPLSDLNAPSQTEALVPNGLAFTPDDAFLGNDKILYLLSKPLQALFRYDLAARRHLSPISLSGAPVFMEYAPALHEVFLGYGPAIIRGINLSANELRETSVATLPGKLYNLAAAGSYLFASYAGNGWSTQSTLNSTGTIISSSPFYRAAPGFVWSDADQKFFFLRDYSQGDPSWQAVNADGTAYPGLAPGAIGTSFSYSSFSYPFPRPELGYPIRISADGAKIVLGTGTMLDAHNFTLLPHSLANAVTDAVWTGDDIISIREISGATEIQKWAAPNYDVSSSIQISGKPLRIFDLKEGRLVVVSLPISGVPLIEVIGADLAVSAPDVLSAPLGLSATIDVGRQAVLNWQQVSGATSYLVERAASPDGSWTPIGSAVAGSSSFSSLLTAGEDFLYRVTAKNGDLASPSSEPVRLSASPPASPNHIVAVSIEANFYDKNVKVSWDSVPTASSYIVERQRLPENTWAQVAEVAAPALDTIDQSIYYADYYVYRVFAKNVFGISTNPAQVRFTFGYPTPIPTPTPTPPPTPTPTATPAPTPAHPTPTPDSTVPPIGPKPDTKRPRISLFPTFRAVTTASACTLAGLASDNRGVDHIEITARGRTATIPFHGSSLWFGQIPLEPGRNSFRIRAVDKSGNKSLPVHAVIVRTP